MAYQPEGVHRVIFISQLTTLLVLQLLPGPTGLPGILEDDGPRNPGPPATAP